MRTSGLWSSTVVLGVSGLMLVAGAVAGAGVAAGAPAGRATAAPGVGGSFVAVTPARVLDTRTHLGSTRPGARATVRVAVRGRGGVPTTGVAGIAINVSAVHPTSSGYLTVYADGSARPSTSSVNFGEGVDRANLVIVPVGPDGMVDLYNGSAGGVDLVGDVEGYYRAGAATHPGSFTQSTPARLYDSRGSAPLGPGSAEPVGVAGRDGVPTTGGVTALVNIVATRNTAAGTIEAYSSGGDAPHTIALSYPGGGGSVAALAFVPVASNGNIELQNDGVGSTDFVVDLVGYIRAGTASTSGTLAAVGATPLVTDQSLAARATRSVHVLGVAGVPSTGVDAVLLDVSAVDPVGASYFTLWPTGSPRPNTSTALWDGVISTTGLVLAKIGTAGDVSVYDGPSATAIEVDVVGLVRA